MISPRSQTLLAVKDVLNSSKWYTQLLGLEMMSKTIADTHGNTYNRLLKDGELVLQLHSWDDENHPNLTDPGKCAVGHGILLWFEVDDFEDAVNRAKKLDATVVLDVFVNPVPKQKEYWILDPDGYHVVLSSANQNIDKEQP